MAAHATDATVSRPELFSNISGGSQASNAMNYLLFPGFERRVEMLPITAFPLVHMLEHFQLDVLPQNCAVSTCWHV